MYSVKPKAVFAHERVFKNPLAQARMERMLDAMGVPLDSVPRVTLRDAREIIEASGAVDDVATEDIRRGGHGRVRQGRVRLTFDPVIVFNTFVWDPDEREPVPPELKVVNPVAARMVRLLAGVGEDFAFSRRELLQKKAEWVCQGGWGIHSVAGCLHKCDYCGNGFLVTLQLDLENFCDHLRQMFADQPEQHLHRYDLYSDVLAFDPEYGASEVVGRCFEETDDKYLLHYTRSDNVDHLLDLPYKSHVLINWTLSMETVAREIERDSPPLDARIDAMRRCQEAGYVVRAGFSPIIPIKNWREETTAMLEQLFAKVRPEVLRLWVLAMMDADEFETMFAHVEMDEAFMKRLRESASEMNGRHDAPFPVDVRAEIYRYYLREIRRISPETPVALCTEYPVLWEMLADELAMTPDRMFCCCGGLSVPGGWKRRSA